MIFFGEVSCGRRNNQSHFGGDPRSTVPGSGSGSPYVLKDFFMDKCGMAQETINLDYGGNLEHNSDHIVPGSQTTIWKQEFLKRILYFSYKCGSCRQPI